MDSNSPLISGLCIYLSCFIIDRVPSIAALNEAKYNVDKHFAVVGVMEDLHGFFQILEYLFPDYFRGASALFYDHGEYYIKI